MSREVCRARGEHRIAVSPYTGLSYCLDCDWEEMD